MSNAAPGAGLEPATNALHFSLSFQKGWTISSPVLGAGRFPSLSRQYFLSE
jgi:hypothetical protein